MLVVEHRYSSSVWRHAAHGRDLTSREVGLLLRRSDLLLAAMAVSEPTAISASLCFGGLAGTLRTRPG